MSKEKLLLLGLLLYIPLEAKEQYMSRNTVYYRPFLSSITELLETQNEVLLDKEDKDYRFCFDAIFDYRQNFNRSCSKSCNDFNSYSFWSGNNSLTIGNNNGEADIDGYNLGLGYNLPVNDEGVAGTLTLQNKVRQAAADFRLYYEHKKQGSSFYMKMHVPVVSLTVNSYLDESPATYSAPSSAFIEAETSSGGDANPSSTINYANANYLPTLDYYVSASQYLSGGINDCNSMNGSINKQIRLRRGLVSDHFTVVRAADITASAGYCLSTEKENKFLIGARFTAPTGNVPTSFSMYEPVAGLAGAWSVGGEIYGHYKIWENCNSDRALYINIQGDCSHLVANRTPNFRSFDLKQNGPGSKYLLVQEYVGNYYNNGTVYTAPVTPGNITPAINLTTLPILSKIGVVGSFATQFKYVHDDKWAVSLSGELYGRSQEKISMDIPSIIDFKFESLNNYAVIGRQVGNYYINNGANTDNQSSLYANLCEPLATINKSQDPVQLVGTVPNVMVPSPLPEGIADATVAGNRIPAEFSEALDICGAQVPSVLSGTILLSVDRIWEDVPLLPTFSIFGGAELTSNNSLPQMWVVGISGNIQF